MLSNFDFLVILQGQPNQGSGWLTMLGMFIFFFAFMYLFTIRPQKIKEKKHQEAVARLIKGNEVMLEGGIYGEVSSVDKDTVFVKIADKVVIKVHQRAIRLILTGDAAEKVNLKEELK